ncbi:phasin family protein [Paraburkholderia mimosarum]|uniref:phasin family protein n=1 Tax=Paraburkholderia mimosarum TaxID=312026 RepID=UPI000482C12C|nr:phasin family protein [Paraburkholderia mimosarum]
MMNREQTAALQKVTLDCVLDLNNNAFESIEKLTTLNVQLTRATLSKAIELAQKGVLANDLRSPLALQESIAIPTVERVQIYSHGVAGLLLDVEAEVIRVTKVLNESWCGQLQTMAENVAKNAPIGAETAMNSLNSSIWVTNMLFGSLQNIGQQALRAARSNLETADEASKMEKHPAIPPKSR